MKKTTIEKSTIESFLETDEGQKLSKWYKDNYRTNKHHEKALKILKNALQSAANDPAMTPEIKEIAEMFALLVEDREPFEYGFDAIINPVVKIVSRDTKSESGKNGAKWRHAASYELHKKIKDVWASGKYFSRDICAEQEYSALGFGSFKAARCA